MTCGCGCVQNEIDVTSEFATVVMQCVRTGGASDGSAGEGATISRQLPGNRNWHHGVH